MCKKRKTLEELEAELDEKEPLVKVAALAVMIDELNAEMVKAMNAYLFPYPGSRYEAIARLDALSGTLSPAEPDASNMEVFVNDDGIVLCSKCRMSIAPFEGRYVCNLCGGSITEQQFAAERQKWAGDAD